MNLSDMVVTSKPVATSTGKRTSYSIDVKAGRFPINEWGLSESVAKMAHETLIANGEQPFSIDGLTFSRRAPSELAAEMAAFRASIKAPTPSQE